MGLESKASGSESRFESYVEAITSGLGHADRVVPFNSYCLGLLLPGDRKSVEPMAARVQPARVRAAHQSMHHFVAKSEWSDNAVLAAVHARVLPTIAQRGRIRALIIDDTAIPKKGKHSVGVARQYCGQLGKRDNCQVAVSLSAANDHASLPIAYRLYLPHEWCDDPVRRVQAGIPDTIVFQTKPRIALDQLRDAVATGINAAVVLADAGYGNDTDFRDGITELGLASSPPPACGRPASNPCRPNNGVGAAVERRRSVVMPSISRSRPSNWRWTCPRQPGGGSPGVKGPTPGSSHASPPCVCALHIAIINVPQRAPKNGA
jgi:SRSO17 transposase